MMKFLTTILPIIILYNLVIIQIDKPMKITRKTINERVKKSPNFINGEFKNIEPTQTMANDVKYTKLLKDFTRKIENTIPSVPIITQKFETNKFTDTINPVAYTWFGHSTVLLNINGTIIITDPVFSNYASPVWFVNRSFEYTQNYNVNMLPKIDIVIISHDHYDHLDKKSIKALAKNGCKFYVPLGVEKYLVKWGIQANKIFIADWWDSFTDTLGLKLTCAPARHFSGRGLTSHNKTLWCSWIIEKNNTRVFFSGDTGYGTHFKQIANKFNSFDLAFIECGQYNPNWRYIHGMPEQTVQAAADINAKFLVPIHWGKFKLSTHQWDEPINRALKHAKTIDINIIETIIGSIITVDNQHNK